MHAGHDVLNGELVLPSGLGLSLGAMIYAMRRKKVMDAIFQVIPDYLGAGWVCG